MITYKIYDIAVWLYIFKSKWLNLNIKNSSNLSTNKIIVYALLNIFTIVFLLYYLYYLYNILQIMCIK